MVTGDDRANRLEGGPSFDIVTSSDDMGGNDVIIGHSSAVPTSARVTPGRRRTRCTAPKPCSTGDDVMPTPTSSPSRVPHHTFLRGRPLRGYEKSRGGARQLLVGGLGTVLERLDRT